ncbi:MAG: hypothetical protein HYY06_05790 [Deltaproteobacteria bacterium]|nr:hypothetical protein [Deltaproteobacteria bacterium]
MTRTTLGACWILLCPACFLSHDSSVRGNPRDAAPPAQDGSSAGDAGYDAKPSHGDASAPADAAADARADSPGDAGAPVRHPCARGDDCNDWYEFGAHCVGGFCCNGWNVDGQCVCGRLAGGCPGDGLWRCCDNPLVDYDDDVEDCQQMVCPGDNEF